MTIDAMWILFFLGYGVCSVLSYGGSLAYFQREWPTLAQEDADNDWRFSLLVALAGPCALPIVLIRTRGFCHGFQWRLAQRRRL